MADPATRRQVSYRLTSRGLSAIPIVEGLVLFGLSSPLRTCSVPGDPHHLGPAAGIATAWE